LPTRFLGFAVAVFDFAVRGVTAFATAFFGFAGAFAAVLLR